MNEIDTGLITPDQPARPFSAAWQAEIMGRSLSGAIRELLHGIEALEAIAEAGQANGCSQEARGLGWVVERMSNDLLVMQEQFEAFRASFAAPTDGGEADADCEA